MASSASSASALAALLLVGPSTALAATPPYPACPSGLSCGKVSPPDLPGMEFDCAYAQSTAQDAAGNVYLMHGNDGLQSKGMWAETMTQLAAEGYNCVACDQRGYSPGAAPGDQSAYTYDLLASDIFSIADAVGFNASTPTGFGGKFHLVAHDQGARVAWHAIAKGIGRQRFLSFSTLSIPHADVFSSHLCCGNETDATDQTAGQYVRQLVLPNSTTVNDNDIFNKFCTPLGYSTPEQCQTSFWWYNGAITSGAMALAPLMPFGSSIASKINIPYDQLKNITQYPLEGVPQTVKVGVVSELPVFFACGEKDSADLCTDSVAKETGSMVASNYTYVINTCGHQLIRVSDCPDDQRQKVIDAIIANVVSGS